MRAAAITQVVWAHGYDLLGSIWPRPTEMSWIDGVDLFFVLSGFLVGGILIKTAERTDMPWYKALLNFWQRRWLRTLPNYYLFLLVNILLAWTGVSRGVLNHNTWAYFVFLQNFHIPLVLFFWESWSLAVEEWFYLLLPIIVFATSRMLRFRVRDSVLLGALVMIILPLVYRMGHVEDIHSLWERDMNIRKLVLARLDTIGYGVLAAWVAHYFKSVWLNRKWILFGLGVVALWANPQNAEQLHFLTTWYFSLTGIALALLLPALSTWTLSGSWTRPITFMSRISYALYLVHLPLRHFFLVGVEERSFAATLIMYALFWATAIAISAAVYRWYELPFMRLRGKVSGWLGVP